MSVFKISLPTAKQVVNSIERVLAVFLVSGLTYWNLEPNKFSRAAVVAGLSCGVTAVYQLVKSSTTTL